MKKIHQKKTDHQLLIVKLANNTRDNTREECYLTTNIYMRRIVLLSRSVTWILEFGCDFAILSIRAINQAARKRMKKRDGYDL